MKQIEWYQISEDACRVNVKVFGERLVTLNRSDFAARFVKPNPQELIALCFVRLPLIPYDVGSLKDE
jgi:hypothetical protein